MSPDEGSGGESLWHIPDLQDGLDLVKKLDPYNDHAVKISPCELCVHILLHVHVEAVHDISLPGQYKNFKEICFATAAGTPPKVPDGAQLVFMDTRLFWNYPQFLPASGFSMLHIIHVRLSTWPLFTNQAQYLGH